MSGIGSTPPPLGINRVAVPVSYLTSLGVATAQSCAHLYVVAENESRLPRGKKPQKRLLVIADRGSFQSDLDVAISKCVMFSQIKTIMLLEDHLSPLTGPFCEYDLLVQQSTTFDFIRTISAVFKPQTAQQLPTYTIEEHRLLSETVECRLAPNAFHDTVGTAAQEATIRQLRAQKDREIVALQEALQKQKDESLLEMVDLHTQNETLKHNLAQAEQALLSSRRAFKEERELLVAKLRQLEAEREIRGGRGPIIAGTPRGEPNSPGFVVPNPSYVGGGDTDRGFQTPHKENFQPTSASLATGVRPTYSPADAPFASSRYTAATQWPTAASGLAPPLTTASSPIAAAGTAVGRSPRAAFEHLEKTLSDGERFLANTQRRVY